MNDSERSCLNDPELGRTVNMNMNMNLNMNLNVYEPSLTMFTNDVLNERYCILFDFSRVNIMKVTTELNCSRFDNFTNAKTHFRVNFTLV